MKKIYLITAMLLASCATNKEVNDLSYSLKKEFINDVTGVVFRAPGDWRVVTTKDKSIYVASRYGHGLETCRVGPMKIDAQHENLSLADLDNYFLDNAIAKIEQKGKLKFIKSNVEKLDNIIIGGTHKNEVGSGIVIRGFVKNIEAVANQHMAIYIAYSGDIHSKAGVECSMLGKDKNDNFLNLFKAIVKSIRYKNEYYQ